MGNSVREIMRDFARRTGLEPDDGPARRYLWTDAFAVCNFLGLYAEEGDAESLRLALRLVDETHRVLGRHRQDDARRGWISGLDDEKGAAHPTLGGLRIGKELAERGAGEPLDSTLEWERDGQYFHYLTKWMHALDSVSRVTREPIQRRWAVELARRAHARFVVIDAAGSPSGFHWKMSIDLSRPLVPSMGQHDPLDAFLTYCRLQGGDGASAQYDLHREIDEAARVCRGRNWYTDDALGIGGLLTDAYALARMMAEGLVSEPVLLGSLLEAAVAGLETVVESRALNASAGFRLPFREFGLSIGLRAARPLAALIAVEPDVFSSRASLSPALDSLERFENLPSRVESFWLDPANRASRNWVEHRDINEVMLATSLAPYGYLEI